jgi:two-component sensor histidine kinase
VSARGRGSDEGIHRDLMFGVFLDVTGRKQAEEGNELLAGEMSHRVKNLLAVASGLTRMASRSTASTADMARELTGMLSALGRAHDIVRPLPGQQGRAALLGDLFSILLAPYDDLGAFAGRVRVAVARMGIGEHASTALALVIHELATNSVKYGALSSPLGTLDVASKQEDDDLIITWTERGGPPVEVADPTNGFGSSMVQRSMAARLGGSIEREWASDGLIVTMRMQSGKLAD